MTKPTSTWALLVALVLLLWLSARLILVTPAERELSLAQHLLLVAEREELERAAAVEREELLVARMKHRISTMLGDAQRLRIAEMSARTEFARGPVARSSSGHFVFPGERVAGEPGGGQRDGT